jgi:hypothetical protein
MKAVSDTSRPAADTSPDTSKQGGSPRLPIGSDTLTAKPQVCPPPKRMTLTVETKVGPQVVVGSVLDGLFVHRTIAVPGWTVSHARSGQAVVTRLPDRTAAHAVRTTLLSMADWTAPTPLADAQIRAAVLAYVQSCPRWQSKKPLRLLSYVPLAPSVVRAAWVVRAMGLNGHHDQPFLLPPTAPLTRTQERARHQVELWLSRTIPPIPNGALVTYYRHDRLRGGIDEPDEGRVVKSRWRPRERQWRFYLSNGLSLTGQQIRTVAVLKTTDDQEPCEASVTLESVPCFSCRGTRWWRSLSGATICATCHPPACPSLVETWLDTPGKGGDHT